MNERQADDSETGFSPQGECEPGGVHSNADGPVESFAGAPAIAGRTANDSRLGRPLGVTRPAQISVGSEVLPVGEPRVLLTGTDTLDIGMYVEFGASWPRITAKLAQLKAKARGTTGCIVGGRCAVLAGGKLNYQFHVQYPGFHLYLSRKSRPDGDTPNVFVSLNSELLWHQGERGAVELVQKELADLAGGTVHECRMNRCDLTADLLLPGGVTDGFVRELAVSRVRNKRIFLDSDQMQTLYVGAANSDISLRIYNKSEELIHSQKLWFLPLWGLTENADVWRFEFQIRRPMLKACQINSVDDLMARRGELWKYLTDDWFSLRRLDNENVSRRTMHPLWQIVQECSDRFGPAVESIRRTRSRPSTDSHRVVKQAAASLVGFAAREGESELEAALQTLTEALRTEFQSRNFTEDCQRKAIQLGLNPTGDQT